MNTKNKILVAMSGGVDSSTAVLCLKEQGYSPIGATMVMFDRAELGIDYTDSAPNDAAEAARSMGIEFHTLDVKNEFREAVINNFIEAYQNGETPNPCVVCNKSLKFGRFMKFADEIGCRLVATGHYARVEKCGDRYLLKKALDETKDQSYVLFSLSQDVLSRLILPLGELTKKHVREVAGDAGLENANKKESQDICFIPDGDYAAFIERQLGHPAAPGDFILTDGTVIGSHKGIIRYTTGQHKGLGLGIHTPLYVLEKNAQYNTITLGSSEMLFKKEVRAVDFNWIACTPPAAKMKVSAKIRYRQKEQPATVEVTGDGLASIIFSDAQRAITPGQSVVLYDGDIVIGGGRII